MELGLAETQVNHYDSSRDQLHEIVSFSMIVQH